MSSDTSSSNVLLGRPVEYLKVLEMRTSDGKNEYLLRFRVEGQEDFTVWRSAKALKKDGPLLRAFLQARKKTETEDASPAPQVEPGQAVDCVVCYAFVIEDQSHQHGDICAECWGKIRDLPRSELIELLSKARAELNLSPQVSPAAGAENGTSRSRSVKVRKHRYRSVQARETVAEQYWDSKRAGICIYSGCPRPSGETATCENHRKHIREYQRSKGRSKRTNGICLSCTRPAALGRARCELHLHACRMSVARCRANKKGT